MAEILDLAVAPAAAPQLKPDLHISVCPDRLRLSARCTPDDFAKLQSAWPVPLPDQIGSMSSDGGWAAVRLGPDEWLLLAEGAASQAAHAALSLRGVSVVDVSARSIGRRVSGLRAAEFLNSVLPIDARLLGPGSATRTLVGRVEALVWRATSRMEFEIEVWRSYENYLDLLLTTAGGELDPRPRA